MTLAGPDSANLSTPGGKDHGAQRSGPRLWKRSFCASRQDKNRTVSCRGHRYLAIQSPVSLASPCPPAAPLHLRLGQGASVRQRDRLLPATSTVEGAKAERPCLFASGEASGSEHLGLPPQIRPQPTHPVRQNTAWHPEVNRDLGVRLATPPHLRPLGSTSRCLQCRCVSYFIYFISVFLQDTRWYGTELGEPYVPMEKDHDHHDPRTASSRVTSIPFITSYVMRLVPRWPFLTRSKAGFVELARASDVRSDDHWHPVIGRPL